VLARRASSLLAACEDGRAADLCTGSGAIAAHLARSNPGASVVAVDIDALAVRCARSNGVRAVLGDLGAPLRSDAYHVVTVVAPYVPSDELRFLPADVQRYEPRDALDGGADGLDVIRRVVASASRVLRRGGWLLVEVGGGQDRALAPAFATCGFDAGVPWFDEDGDLRGIVARRR
jgi:release factor glutamine methyltransferase